MFDRGLVSIDDDHRILVAQDHLPQAVAQLLLPDRRLLLPMAAHLRPHPRYLSLHRAGFKG
jgi:putative restriction endonuclease